MQEFDEVFSAVSAMRPQTPVGRVTGAGRGLITVEGLAHDIMLGDRVDILGDRPLAGEVLSMTAEATRIMCESDATGLALGVRVVPAVAQGIRPDASWLGRIIDPFGQPLDGRPLRQGARDLPLERTPPPAARRGMLGARLDCGLAIFDTLLPLVAGQRIGLFAGSGVGKSTLMGDLARNVPADVVVIGLVGERGRELREFCERVLGPEGMRRAIVVTATSDQSPLVRRRCALAAMAVAEHFRDAGGHVLLMIDSITRFAEAHREVALAAGEPPSLRGYPPSTAHRIMQLAERAGPGDLTRGPGCITAIFTVLVAGSDMEEPVADILRGVLDGHVVMDRAIAERGRFPAIDVLRSVSRALPWAASEDENALIAAARRHLGTWDRAELMIRAGLYVPGSDSAVDDAIRIVPRLDTYMATTAPDGIAAAFEALRTCLEATAPAG